MTAKAPTQQTRQLVLERDEHTCVICRRGIRGQAHSLHHRRARGMGGSRDPITNGPANLITLCGNGTSGCHGRVEADPTAARRHGWRVDQDNDPRTAPLMWMGRWVWLTHEGKVIEGVGGR